MKSVDQVGITFANAVLGSGVLGGVVNVQLGAFQFTNDGDKTDADLSVVARLRMDLGCARQLQSALTDVLQLIPQEDVRSLNGSRPLDETVN